MANTIKLRRSAVSGNVPTTGQLELGEMAINTADGVCYIKRNDGTGDEIVRVGGSSTLQSTKYRFETSTSSTPGGGKMHFNAAFGTDYSNVTAIYLNNTDKAGQDLSNLFTAFLGDTYRIYVQKESDASKATLFQVTAAPTVGASVTTIPVSFIQDTGTALSDGKDCAVLFSNDPSASLTLGGLADVSVPTPSDGQVLGWVAANNQWEAINQTGGGGGGSVTVSATAPSSPSNGDQWYNTDDGRTYIYFTDSGGSSQWADQSPQSPAAQNLDDLGDVDTTGVTNGQVIVYQSGTWQAGDAAASLSDLTDTTITSPAANEVLKYNGTAWVNDTAATGASAIYTVVGAGYSVPANDSTFPNDANAWATGALSVTQLSGSDDWTSNGTLLTCNKAGLYKCVLAGTVAMDATSNNQANGVIIQQYRNTSNSLVSRTTLPKNDGTDLLYYQFTSTAHLDFTVGQTWSFRAARWGGTTGSKTILGFSTITFQEVV